MISIEEQNIYNTHLAVSRKVKHEPFKIRRDFSKLEESKLAMLAKLARLFASYPSINQECFFYAPYRIYDDSTYYPLDFYTTHKAVVCYTQYMKQIELEDPDNEQSMDRLKNSLKFVFLFCKENGLTFDEYRVFSKGSLPCFLEHLKNHKINFYTLHALTFSNPNIESKILEFVIPDFFLIFQKTKNKFFNSKVMMEFSIMAKKKLDEKLKLC